MPRVLTNTYLIEELLADNSTSFVVDAVGVFTEPQLVDHRQERLYALRWLDITDFFI